MIPAHKIGDTFSWGGTYAATDAAGQPVDVSGATATAQLRTPSGSLIADLAVKHWDGSAWRVAKLKAWDGGVQ